MSYEDDAIAHLLGAWELPDDCADAVRGTMECKMLTLQFAVAECVGVPINNALCRIATAVRAVRSRLRRRSTS